MVTEALRILDRIPGVHAWETRAVIAELDVPDGAWYSPWRLAERILGAVHRKGLATLYGDDDENHVLSIRMIREAQSAAHEWYHDSMASLRALEERQ